MKLSGATVLVTGASSGIGRATALELARRDAVVLCVARTASKLEALVQDIEADGGRAHALPCDLSDVDAVTALGERVLADHGAPDALVNNAGAGRWLSVEETPPGEVVDMMGAPYFAAFHVTRALLPAMVARGSGRVLQVNSPACLFGFPGAAGYSASRAALRSFDQALGGELEGTGVGVTHLIAGEVSSAYFDHNPGSHERLPGIARIYRVLPPEEVAIAIARALEREPRQVVIPRLMWWTWLTYELAPWLVRWATMATAWRRPA